MNHLELSMIQSFYLIVLGYSAAVKTLRCRDNGCTSIQTKSTFLIVVTWACGRYSRGTNSTSFDPSCFVIMVIAVDPYLAVGFVELAEICRLNVILVVLLVAGFKIFINTTSTHGVRATSG